jgi:hypothetical protein
MTRGVSAGGDVESQLGGVKLFIVGYGDDANLDGPLLTKLARDHGDLYVRADHGLALRKFFGLETASCEGYATVKTESDRLGLSGVWSFSDASTSVS